ncbi:MAG: DUF3298 domain-containing protein [Bacteroidota bacterium]
MKFKQIRQLVQDNDLEGALAALQDVVTDGALADELLIIISNYNAVKSNIRKNLLAFEEATIKENRIRNAVLELIDAAETGTPLKSARPKEQVAGKRKSYLALKVMVGLTLVFVCIIFMAILIPTLVSSSDEPTGSEPASPTSETHNNISGNDNVLVGDNNKIIVNEAEQPIDPTTAEMSFQNYTEEFTEYLHKNPEKVAAKVNLSFEDPIDYFDKAQLQFVKEQLYKDVFKKAAVPGNFKASAVKYSQVFFAGFQERYSGPNAAPEPPMYYETLDAKVLYNENQVLTIRISEDSYTGGVHGNSYDNYYTYDLKTGQSVTSGDFFRGKTQKLVIKLLEKELMEINEVSTLDQLQGLGFWEVTIPKNFYIKNKTICFVYSPYEAAAYVNGKNVICLTYDDIALYLHEDFPLSRLFD